MDNRRNSIILTLIVVILSALAYFFRNEVLELINIQSQDKFLRVYYSGNEYFDYKAGVATDQVVLASQEYGSYYVLYGTIIDTSSIEGKLSVNMLVNDVQIEFVFGPEDDSYPVTFGMISSELQDQIDMRSQIVKVQGTGLGRLLNLSKNNSIAILFRAHNDKFLQASYFNRIAASNECSMVCKQKIEFYLSTLNSDYEVLDKIMSGKLGSYRLSMPVTRIFINDADDDKNN